MFPLTSALKSQDWGSNFTFSKPASQSHVSIFRKVGCLLSISTPNSNHCELLECIHCNVHTLYLDEELANELCRKSEPQNPRLLSLELGRGICGRVLSCLCDCHGPVLDMLHSASDPHSEQPDEAMTPWLWHCFDILGFFPFPSKHILNEQVCTNHQKSLLISSEKRAGEAHSGDSSSSYTE